MGLDMVELVIALEERFDIEISDGVAETLTTPRLTIDWICSQVELAQSPCACLSQQTFYRLRGLFCNHLGLPRQAIALDVRLADLVAEHNRQVVWAELGRLLSARCWPPLVRPRWMVRSLFAALVLLPAALALVSNHGVPVGGWSLFAGGTIWILWLVLAARLTRRFRRNFPPEASTVRALVGHLAIWLPGPVKPSRKQVAEIVRAVIHQQTGLTRFDDDDDYIRTLGLG